MAPVGPGLTGRVASILVAVAGRLAPRAERAGFVREWRAELSHAFRPDPPRRPPGPVGRIRLCLRASLALADAAHLRLGALPAEGLVRDLRFAVRSLLRRPGFAALAVITVGLGIGANTAIFSVVNAVVLRPLPYPDPHELVAVWENAPERGWTRVPGSAEDFLAWRDEARAFRELAAGASRSYALTGEGGDPEQVPGMAVTAGFFEVFGVAPLLGAPFGPEAEVPGADRRVVLSHGLWQRRYGGDRGVVGTTVQVDDQPYEVAAVMPEGFAFPTAARLWTPLAFSDAQLQDRNWHFLMTVGRLAEGVEIETARAEMQTLAAGLEAEFPDSNEGWGVDVFLLHGEMTQQVRSMLWILLGAVGFVLLIACANVANLLLVRASGRAREMALRTSLGAGKARLVGQLLTESLVLAAAGAAVGLLLAHVGLEALLAFAPVTVPGGGEVTIDGTVLGFTALGALLTGLVFGAAPAAVVWKADLQTALRSGDRAQVGTSGRKLRSALVVAEMAVALVLVTGAGLMIQTVQGLLSVDVGIEQEGLLLAPFALPQAAYPTPEERIAFYDELLDRAGGMPGVRGAALTPVVPPAGGPQIHHRVEGVHEAWTMDLPVARIRTVSPGFFETMGIPLVRGRAFRAEDRRESPRVVVVDQAFADFLFPGEDPIGRRIRTLDDEPREIVGVVGNVANAGLQNDPQPTSYLPYRQTPWGAGHTLVLRSEGEPSALARPVQELIWSLDPDLPLLGIETMEQRLSSSVAQPRFNSLLLGLFALLALVLAGVGIYGVMAFTVTERTGEIGLRMALGASATEVRGLVVRRALRLTLLGVGLGVAASLALGRVLQGFLYGVEPGDPLTYAAVSVVLCAVAMAGSYLPALRASRLDPLRALQAE